MSSSSGWKIWKPKQMFCKSILGGALKSRVSLTPKDRLRIIQHAHLAWFKRSGSL
jgi:hypothetical protein